MHDFSCLPPLIVGVLCLKNPNLFRNKRWTKESFIVIRGMGVTLIALGIAFMVVR